jgi:hypothetical protein
VSPYVNANRTCLEPEGGASLEQKSRWSENIVVARWRAKRKAFKALKVLKGKDSIGENIFVDIAAAGDERARNCAFAVEAADSGELVLFLKEEDGAWHHRFRAAESSDKLTQVISRLVRLTENGERLVDATQDDGDGKD